jgi:hypothetical protein
MKTSVRIAGVLVGIRSESLPITCIERYSYTKALSSGYPFLHVSWLSPGPLGL